MQSIARDTFGSISYWRAIARANPTVDPNKLRVGTVLRIPIDPDNIQGRPTNADAPPAPDLPDTRYIAQRGDTLSEIASRIYGRSALWTLIRDANIDKVGRDGTRLRPGMELVIPQAPAE